jgi:hypothetical protein
MIDALVEIGGEALAMVLFIVLVVLASKVQTRNQH